MSESVLITDDQTPLQTDEEIYVEAKRLFNVKKYDESFLLLQTLIDRENPFPEALNILGVMYGAGLGVDRNDEEAFSFYQRAHDLGNMLAASNLADCYIWAKGTKRNIPQAIQLYEIAVERGDLESAFWLGRIFDPTNDNNQHTNKEKAIERYRIAAMGGFYEAQYNLANLLYVDGENEEAAFFAAEAMVNSDATDDQRAKAVIFLADILKNDIKSKGAQSELAQIFARAVIETEKDRRSFWLDPHVASSTPTFATGPGQNLS